MTPAEQLAAVVENMPHNGTRMFSTNKNELGHDECCFKCKLEPILAELRRAQQLTDKWLLKLMLRISTDCSQTAIEDPVKYADGWVLHSQPVLEDIAEAARMLSAPPLEEPQ
jgi:hypothetical protein